MSKPARIVWPAAFYNEEPMIPNYIIAARCRGCCDWEIVVRTKPEVELAFKMFDQWLEKHLREQHVGEIDPVVPKPEQYAWIT